MDMLARIRRASWVFPTLLLAGCATTGVGPYDSLRADYDGAALPASTEQADGDPSMTGAALERAAFVRAVIHRNPTIESSRQAWRAALARVRQSGSFEDPIVDVSVAPLSIASSQARFGYNVGISQRLPWFGKRALDTAVAAAEAEAAKRDLEATRRELALTASLLFDQYFVAVRSLEINVHHVTLMRSIRAAAIAQFEAGRASAQDPLQAEAELTHMEHDAVILVTQRDITVAQMNELLHRDPDEPLPPPPNELALPPEADTRDTKRLQTEALERRPDIAAARIHARAEHRRAERANRDYYPDFNVSTSFNSMWDLPEHRWMVGLGLNLPIQAGRRGGAVEEANAARARFESEALRMGDVARTQVSVGLKRLEESRHILHLFERRLLPVAKDQVDAARAGFVASQNPFVAVIDAEKNLRSVELEYQMARADCNRRHAELDRALGRVPGLGKAEEAR